MANTYIYGWDSANKKKVYMGKYPSANPRSRGYYGNAEAGNPQEFVPKTWGTKREFIGSGEQSFVFYSDTGTLTVRADSWAEAWRIAKARGYHTRRRK